MQKSIKIAAVVHTKTGHKTKPKNPMDLSARYGCDKRQCLSCGYINPKAKGARKDSAGARSKMDQSPQTIVKYLEQAQATKVRRVLFDILVQRNSS